MLQDLLKSLVQDLDLWLKMLIYVASFAVGVVCLVKFCDIFVDSASTIAKKLKIPAMVIGLTIVAMGTSLPELSVSLGDALDKTGTGEYASIAIGNVVGSNICNVLLVLALSVLVTPIAVSKSTIRRENPILVGVSVLLAIFIIFFNEEGVIGQPVITRWEGIVLLVLFVAYLVNMFVQAKRHPEELGDDVTPKKDMSWAKAIIFCVLGCAGIILGGQFVNFGAENIAVDGAVAIGLDEKLATSLVAYTIVAVGTSLPELVTSVMAAKKGENDIALGNVIGSNIFNALFILGTSATVTPLSELNTAIVDAIVMVVVAVALLLISLKGKLKRRDGIIMLCCYALYATYMILRTVFNWTW